HETQWSTETPHQHATIFGGRGKKVTQGWPNCNRYTEATCELLMKVYPGDQKLDGRLWTRWRLVLQAFHHIRQVIVKSPNAMEKTDIQLPLLIKRHYSSATGRSWVRSPTWESSSISSKDTKYWFKAQETDTRAFMCA
ncbi:hypothetical protein DPMN_043356, partial [Dreissena polymorpha]